MEGREKYRAPSPLSESRQLEMAAIWVAEIVSSCTEPLLRRIVVRHVNDSANRLAFVHEMKGFVDLREG